MIVKIVYKSLKVFILFIVAFLIFCNYKPKSSENKERDVIDDTMVFDGVPVPEYFPGYTDVEQVSKVLFLVKKEDVVMGKLIVSTPFSDELTGFGGEVPVLLMVSVDDRIMQLVLLSNAESPDFIAQITETGFFESWNNKLLSEAAALQVEGVSGASMTTDAVKDGVFKALNYQLQTEQTVVVPDWVQIVKSVAGVAVLVFAFLSMIAGTQLKKYRWLLLLSSILVFGVWYGYFVSFALLYSWLLNGVPFAGRLLLVVLVTLSLLIPLFTGKAYYCSYVCPFGAAQELAGRWNKRKLRWGRIARKVLKYTRITYFIAILGVLIAGVIPDLSQFEPFSVFMYGTAGRWMVAFALTIFVLSVFTPRPWCNHFCPTGELLELLRKGKPKVPR